MCFSYLRIFPVKYNMDIWTYTPPRMHWGAPEFLFLSAIGNKRSTHGNVGFQDIISLRKLNLSQIDRLQRDFKFCTWSSDLLRFLYYQAQQRKMTESWNIHTVERAWNFEFRIFFASRHPALWCARTWCHIMWGSVPFLE